MKEEPCPHTEAMATKVNGWLKEFFILYLYIVPDFLFFLRRRRRQAEQRFKKNLLSDYIKTASLSTQLHVPSISNCRESPFFKMSRTFNNKCDARHPPHTQVDLRALR